MIAFRASRHAPKALATTTPLGSDLRLRLPAAEVNSSSPVWNACGHVVRSDGIVVCATVLTGKPHSAQLGLSSRHFRD